MRFPAGRFVGPASLVRSASGWVGRPSCRARVHLEMYARIGRESDVNDLIRRYVDEVTPTVRRLSIFRWFRGLNPWAVDAVIGTVFTALGIVALFANSQQHYDYADIGLGAVLLTLGATLPYFFRRRAPFVSMMVVEVFVVLVACFQYPAGMVAQLFFIGAYTLGSWVEGTRRVIAFVTIVVGPLIVAAVGVPDASTVNLFLYSGVYAGVFFLGTAMRNRRLYLQQLEERTMLLERERDEEAKRAVADERLRIAQELHDVVAHSMGVIAVQAGVGAHVIDDDPAEAKKSLEAIAATSRATLTELRRLLGVLRSDEGA
jgi:signal transduction histidine kinase